MIINSSITFIKVLNFINKFSNTYILLIIKKDPSINQQNQHNDLFNLSTKEIYLWECTFNFLCFHKTKLILNDFNFCQCVM